MMPEHASFAARRQGGIRPRAAKASRGKKAPLLFRQEAMQDAGITREADAQGNAIPLSSNGLFPIHLVFRLKRGGPRVAIIAQSEGSIFDAKGYLGTARKDKTQNIFVQRYG